MFVVTVWPPPLKIFKMKISTKSILNGTSIDIPKNPPQNTPPNGIAAICFSPNTCLIISGLEAAFL